MSGQGGRDAIEGDAGEDKIYGGDGGDDITGGTNDDTISADGGADQVSGGAGADNIAGGDGNDTIAGDAGNDALYGGADEDSVYGGDGGDQLSGESGNDLLNGGDGADTIFGGAGSDTGDFSDAPGPVAVNLATHQAAGGAGADEVSGVEVVDGSAFADDLSGDAQDNTLNGGPGADTLNGGAGNDTENGGAGNNTFDQGTSPNGEDTMSGGDGVDTVDYTKRESAVHATNDGVADDGETGENDNILPTVEVFNLRPRPLAPLTVAPDLTAPSLTLIRANATFISPNGDRRQDALRVTAQFSETTTWTFEILAGASAVYVQTGKGTAMAATWNGRTGLGQRAVSDTYAWRLSGKDAAGNEITPRTGTIDVDRLHARIRNLHVRGTKAIMRISEAATISARVRRGSELVRRFAAVALDGKGIVTITWNGRDERGRPAAAGRYRMVIAARDLAGNVTTKSVAVRLP
jgi:Ca2+-binding RTX toxin-like protein